MDGLKADCEGCGKQIIVTKDTTGKPKPKGTRQCTKCKATLLQFMNWDDLG